ncbi:MAG: hypothetical protein ACYC63_06115 [Armatimonadota bacterium]
MLQLAGRTLVVLLLCCCCALGFAEPVTTEQAKADAAKVLALHAEYYPKFEGIYGGIAVNGGNEAEMLELCRVLEHKIKVLDEEVLPVLEPFMAQFDERYNKEGDAEWALKQLKVEDSFEASNRFRDLARAMENIAKTRKASAQYLADFVQNGSDINFFVMDIRVPKLKERKLFLQWALKFDPANKYANERLATMDQEIADLQKAIEKEIDSKSWAGHIGSFSGPGTTSGLAQEALNFLRQSKEWGAGKRKEKILAVAVRGPWQVAEKDFFGRVTSWRLPIHAAVTRPEDQARNIARVYELSVVTVTTAPGAAKKAPPFDGAWVGNSWMMRLNKLPQ